MLRTGGVNKVAMFGGKSGYIYVKGISGIQIVDIDGVSSDVLAVQELSHDAPENAADGDWRYIISGSDIVNVDLTLDGSIILDAGVFTSKYIRLVIINDTTNRVVQSVDTNILYRLTTQY